jgi:hypothetical protein
MGIASVTEKKIGNKTVFLLRIVVLDLLRKLRLKNAKKTVDPTKIIYG